MILILKGIRGIKDQMSEHTKEVGPFINNWDNYQNQIKRYLQSIQTNPYVIELEQDFQKSNVENITQHFNKDFTTWFNQCIKTNHISYSTIYSINSLFNSTILMREFCNYIQKNILLGKIKQLLAHLTKEYLEELHAKLSSNVPVIKFKPSELKFVTTTGLAILNTSVDFVRLYNLFTPPSNIVQSVSSLNSVPYFNPKVINSVVGCKTGNSPVKGFFKNKDVGDFYNCSTLQIVLGENKCANVKLFNNGKLQLTGIPHPDIGTTAVQIICDLIKNLSENNTGSKLLLNDGEISLKSYKTVMINTCYDLGIYIDRDITSHILNNRYNFNTVWEGDGYPGVRILYYYNDLTVNTENEGKCVCTKTLKDGTIKPVKCAGKGDGKGINKCRKISIAVFQSGKIIIAGGCQSTEPIYRVYDVFNKIIKAISPEIQKIDNIKDDKKNSTKPSIFLDKRLITNNDVYKNILKTIRSSEF